MGEVEPNGGDELFFFDEVLDEAERPLQLAGHDFPAPSPWALAALLASHELDSRFGRKRRLGGDGPAWYSPPLLALLRRTPAGLPVAEERAS